jgi:hypothetical protein
VSQMACVGSSKHGMRMHISVVPGRLDTWYTQSRGRCTTGIRSQNVLRIKQQKKRHGAERADTSVMQAGLPVRLCIQRNRSG